jgi:hypothetical protein
MRRRTEWRVEGRTLHEGYEQQVYREFISVVIFRSNAKPRWILAPYWGDSFLRFDGPAPTDVDRDSVI